MQAEELTNDESTWTNAIPATQEDEKLFADHYLPWLCNAFVYERQGGETEVTLRTGISIYKFRADNITSDGTLHENKATVVRADGEFQLSKYLRYLDQNGGPLNYNFFRNPLGSPVGPDFRFASALAEAAIKYDIGVNIYDYDWWEVLQ